MKSIISRGIAILIIIAGLSSFTTRPGGEGFHIYLNGKLWLQQYDAEMKQVKVLSLDKTKPGDQLTLKYHHCGKTGINRIVSIKDGKDNVLREFRFDDVTQPFSPMDIRLGDISSLAKPNENLRLYYSSSELPGGRMLVAIQPASRDITMK